MAKAPTANGEKKTRRPSGPKPIYIAYKLSVNDGVPGIEFVAVAKKVDDEILSAIENGAKLTKRTV